MTTEIDYAVECKLYLKLKSEGKKITQKDFCDRRSKELGRDVSLSYFKKKMCIMKQGKLPPKPTKPTKPTDKKKVTPKKNKDSPANKVRRGVDWDAAHKDYLSGNYSSLSDFARKYGLNPQGYYFRKKTKTWNKDREEVLKKANKKVVSILANKEAADKVRDWHADILKMHWELFDALQYASEASSGWKDKAKTPSTAREVVGFVIDMQKAIEKIMPNIKGLENVADIAKVFDGLSDGSMDIETAAIEFLHMGVALPEPLKIMLQKHHQEEPTQEDGDEITEADILARRREMMMAIETERTEFVHERTLAVVQIKDELSSVNSFAEEGDHGNPELT